MPSCSVLWCKSRSGTQNKTNDHTTYHRFPKEPSLKKMWIEATGRSTTDWIPPTHSTICSKHFVSALFYKSKNGKLMFLRKSAVPTLHLPFYVKTNGLTSEQKTECTNSNIILEKRVDNTKILEPKTSSATECNIETKLKLKYRIHELEFKNVAYRKKIKRLQYLNRNQRKKIASLENMLKSPTNKSSIDEED